MTAFSTRQDLTVVIREVAQKVGVDLCVLFGSRAGECFRVDADVDLALSFQDTPSPERRLELIGQFQAATASLPVDVVFLHRDTDPVLRFEVFRSGQPVFERVPGAMAQQRVKALMLYEDALPLRRMRRNQMLKTGGGHVP